MEIGAFGAHQPKIGLAQSVVDAVLVWLCSPTIACFTSHDAGLYSQDMVKGFEAKRACVVGWLHAREGDTMSENVGRRDFLKTIG
ncbi:MAG: hypothetical protein RR619_10645, partial [Raoultibacter sp.]